MENSIQYTNRPLAEEEIDILVEEIKHIPGIVYMPRFLLRRISNSVVATCDGEFCGACSNYHIKRDIYKLGPLLVRAKYRKMGIGKELLNRSFKALESKTVYAGTSNPSLWNVLTDNGFVQHPLIRLPLIVKFFLIIYLSIFLSPQFLLEAKRKGRLYPRKEYRHYIKPQQTRGSQI